MNSPDILRPLCALILLATSAWSAPVSITVNSSGGAPYVDAFGTPLLPGSVIRIGQFDLSLPANLTLLQTSNDYLALDALFTPLAESLLDAGTVFQAGAPGQQMVINDQFNPGDVFGQIINIEDTYFAAGTPLYTWVFNSPDPLTATQWGIFSSSANWGFPISPGSETLATFEIDATIRGNATGAQFQLSPVPEPGSIALVIVGAGYLFYRSRRAGRVSPSLS